MERSAVRSPWSLSELRWPTFSPFEGGRASYASLTSTFDGGRATGVGFDGGRAPGFDGGRAVCLAFFGSATGGGGAASAGGAEPITLAIWPMTSFAWGASGLVPRLVSSTRTLIASHARKS